MKTLVIGGTGTVGSLVVDELLSRAVSSTETHQGIVGVNCARLAGIGRLVYMSVYNLEQAVQVPHFGSKLPVETVLKSSGIPYTILRPGHFFQNDNGLKDSLLEHGVYTQPIGDAGLSRIDARDIAEAAVIALTESGHDGQTYNVLGPEVFTGKSAAEAWGRVLNKPVDYRGNDLDAWEEEVRQSIPDWKVFDYRLMYEAIQASGLKAGPGDVERLEKLLGRAPAFFEVYAREMAEKWGA